MQFPYDRLDQVQCPWSVWLTFGNLASGSPSYCHCNLFVRDHNPQKIFFYLFSNYFNRCVWYVFQDFITFLNGHKLNQCLNREYAFLDHSLTKNLTMKDIYSPLYLLSITEGCSILDIHISTTFHHGHYQTFYCFPLIYRICISYTALHRPTSHSIQHLIWSLREYAWCNVW